jgi:uncharacterized membrane protein YkvA (DUF1232 family)
VQPAVRASRLDRLKAWARSLKRDAYALYYAARDPRTPWYARLLAGAVVAYALSPFDLIPDVVPVLGYLDDLLIVPAGIALAVRLVPARVLADCRGKAAERAARPTSLAGAVAIVAIWAAVALLVGLRVADLLGG